MKKILFISILVIIISGLSFAGGTSEGSEKVYKLKLSTDLQSSHPLIGPMNDWAKSVEEKTDGRIVITIYPDSTLGAMNSVIDSVRSGSIDMVTTLTQASVHDPAVGIFDYPFMFDNLEQAEKVAMESDVFDEIAAGLVEKANLRILEFYPLGFRSFISREPVKNAEDLKGQRLRVPNIPVYLELFKSLGINGQTVAYSEVLPAVEQGVIDGMDGALPSLVATRIYEVSKNVYVSNHMLLMYSHMINEKVYQSFPEDLKVIFDEETKKMAYNLWEVGIKSEKEALETLESAGCEITFASADDTVKMKNAAKNVKTVFTSKIDNFDEIIGNIENEK